MNHIGTNHRGLGKFMDELREIQCSYGAQIQDDLPLSFGNDALALAAATQSVALYDRSHWGRIRVGERDRLSFLHNQTTNNFKPLKPGQGCEAVIVTSTARTIDLISAYVCEEDVLLLSAPSTRSTILGWFDRYIFFGDKVQLEDITKTTVCFSLVGPGSLELLQRLGVTELPQQDHGHCLSNAAQVQFRLAVGSGLGPTGYTLIAAQSDGLKLWKALVEANAVPIGETVWEQLRIQQGRPMPGTELTEDYNPLEAGLWHTVSFDKGCYIGQETIARLKTYNGVKQQLWGVQLTQPHPPNTPLFLDEQKVGVLTSVVAYGQDFLGLGYIKTKAGGAGLTVQVGNTSARVLDVPFLSRSEDSTHGVESPQH